MPEAPAAAEAAADDRPGAKEGPVAAEDFVHMTVRVQADVDFGSTLQRTRVVILHPARLHMNLGLERMELDSAGCPAHQGNSRDLLVASVGRRLRQVAARAARHSAVDTSGLEAPGCLGKDYVAAVDCMCSYLEGLMVGPYKSSQLHPLRVVRR